MILLALLIVLTACHNQSNHEKIKSAQWLTGKWESKTADGILEETWKTKNDSVLSGTSFFIKDQDTIHFETMSITQKEDNLVYEATIIGQNNDQAIHFLLTSETDNSFVFENPKHDYPQKIHYQLISKNKLKATISGKQDGKASAESFDLIKIN